MKSKMAVPRKFKSENRRLSNPVLSDTEMLFPCFSMKFLSIIFYYINTNEIPGELSRENMISSHVKITCYLHM